MSLLMNYKRAQSGFANELSLLAKRDTQPTLPDGGKAQRRKTWEISSTFHCSIIGTCLTAAELRHFLAKLGDTDARTASDHALHSRGVRAAGQRDTAGKLLNKALDRRHETILKRFSKLSTAAEVRKLWNECVEQGEISGAYWAVMSHPATDHALVQDVFGEVHMLSHLVGSSSRLDIARLRKLQTEVDEKNEKISRQEERLHAAAEDRSRLQKRIEELEEGLVRAQAQRLKGEGAAVGEATQSALVHRLEAEKARADALALRLVAMETKWSEAERRLAAVFERAAALEHEVEVLETALAGEEATYTVHSPSGQSSAGTDGRSILYVGGRRNLFERLRALAAQRGIELLVHDGGIEDNNSLLPGLVGQASVTLFPVDCISHSAAGIVKRLCRENGKPYVPMRSASLASFLATIGGPRALAEV